MAKYVAVEVEPVRFFSEGGGKFAEKTTPEKASAWSVYLRTQAGPAKWVKDFKSKRKADAYALKLAKRVGLTRVMSY